MSTTTEMETATFSRASLTRSIGRESFYDFLQIFWPEIIAESPVWNWHIRYLCDELQKVAELVFAGKPKEYDLIINVPPGTTKSTICSVAYPAWAWTRMPTSQFICGSFTQPLALELSTRSRDIVRTDRYRAAFPEIQWREDQNTKSHWKNTKGGYRYACTVGGSVTGMHGHFLVVDDPIDPKGARSQEEIKNANNWMNETLPTRKVSKVVTPIILIMQRLHQNDPTGNQLDSGKNIRHICLPAEISDRVKPPSLKRFYKNGLLDPKRMPRDVLRSIELELGAFGYAGQFHQHPVPLGGLTFNTAMLNIESAHPEYQQINSFKNFQTNVYWKKVVRYWDKAGTKDGGAYTVGVLMGRDSQDAIWVLDVVRGQWASGEREKVIVNTAKLDGRFVDIGVEQEPGSGGLESAQDTSRRLLGFKVFLDRPTGDKTARALPYSSAMNVGGVFAPPAPWVKAYVDELTYFPDSTNKDQVDASSGAFNFIMRPVQTVGAFR